MLLIDVFQAMDHGLYLHCKISALSKPVYTSQPAIHIFWNRRQGSSMVTGKMVADKMVADKMVRTKLYGQNGIWTNWYCTKWYGQTGMDNMVWTKKVTTFLYRF